MNSRQSFAFLISTQKFLYAVAFFNQPQLLASTSFNLLSGSFRRVFFLLKVRFPHEDNHFLNQNSFLILPLSRLTSKRNLLCTFIGIRLRLFCPELCVHISHYLRVEAFFSEEVIFYSIERSNKSVSKFTQKIDPLNLIFPRAFMSFTLTPIVNIYGTKVTVEPPVCLYSIPYLQRCSLS